MWKTCLRTARDVMNGTIPAHIQLVGPQGRQSFARPNQLWRSGGQHFCFSGYKFLSIRRTGAQQRLEYPGSGSVPDGGRAYPHKSPGNLIGGA